MRTFDGIAEAADTTRIFILGGGSGLPAHVLDKVWPQTGTGSSPVSLIYCFAEAVYANREEASADALDIAAGCADYCVQQYNVFEPRERGQKIANVLDGKAVADAPEPQPEFLRPVVQEPGTDPLLPPAL